MPRNGRGGRRQGVEGKAYSNRTDLNQGPRVERRHVRTAAESAPATVTQVPGTSPAPPMPNLLGPTRYPDRPVTHGLSSGPGGGPEALMTPTLTPLQKLLRMYRRDPNPDLLELILLATPDEEF